MYNVLSEVGRKFTRHARAFSSMKQDIELVELVRKSILPEI